MSLQNTSIKKTLEKLAEDHKCSTTDEEKRSTDNRVISYLDFFVSDKKEHDEYLKFYDDEKKKK